MSQNARVPENFLSLTDAPSSYVGSSAKVVSVKADETGLEFTTASGGAGSVAGPATSTDNAVVRWDGALGTLVQNSGVSIDDSQNVTGVNALTANTITLNNNGLAVKGATGSNKLVIQPQDTLSADRVLSIATGDTNGSIDITNGDLSLGGDLITAGSFETTGANALTLGTTGPTNLTLPTSGTVVSTDTSLSALAVPSADLDMDSHKVINVTDPVDPQDACTKAYADSVASGLSTRASVRVGTTADLNATYNGGAKTLTCNVNGAISVDSVSLSTNDRVLVKNQTTSQENGIYSVTTVGTGGTPFVLTRATDNDTDAEMTSGVYTFITSGSTQAATGFVLTTADPITLDTTALSFTQFSGATNYIGGAGLTITGTTIDVGAGTGITVNANNIEVDTSVIQAKDTTLTALAALDGTTGFLVETAADTFTKRTLTVLDGITITDGSGVSNNPAIGVSINTLTTDSSPDPANDYAMTYDASAAGLKKTLIRDLTSGASTLFRQVGTSPLECWYSPAIAQATLSTLALGVAATTSTMYAVPYIEGKGCTIDRMAINVSTAVASTTVRFGIYSSTSSTNLYPSTLVVDAGEIDSTTTGTKTQTVSAGLNKGQLYWFVFIADNSTATLTGPTIRAITAASLPPILGMSSAFGTLPNTYLSITGQTYGALPGTFPAGATVATGNAPAALVRLSA